MTTRSVKMSRREIIQGLAAGSVVAMPAACAVNPETGRNQFILVSNEQLASLSASSWAELKQQEKISTNSAMNSQLSRVGQKITTAAGRADSRWEYVVFDSEAKNAFVLPGQQVGFYRGIMELADNDDQIAAVMGHEVGHVTGRHAAERFSQQMAASGAAIGAQIVLADTDPQTRNMASAALGLGVQFGVLLPYSRKHELEADLLGADYMYRAGYDARQAVRFWEKMAAEGGQRPPEFMSTHPDPERRIREIDQYIRNKGYV